MTGQNDTLCSFIWRYEKRVFVTQDSHFDGMWPNVLAGQPGGYKKLIRIFNPSILWILSFASSDTIKISIGVEHKGSVYMLSLIFILETFPKIGFRWKSHHSNPL